MKNLILFLTLTLFGGHLFGKVEPENNTKYVYAYSGLKLRATPSAEGQVLKVIPYGEKVTVVASTEHKELIEWMSGHWVKVEHEGEEGYLFEGFISGLPIPVYNFEMTQNDLDLTYPLLAWAEHNFDEIKNSDTIQSEQLDKITQYLEHDIVLTRSDNPYDFKVTMELPDSRIEDAYNLLKSMLLTKPERHTFENKSVFLDNLEGDIHRIKVNLEYPVEIRQLKNGHSKIIVKSFHTGCDL